MFAMSRLSFAAAVAVLFTACPSAPAVDSGGGEEQVPPFYAVPTFGNFEVNDTAVVTHQEAMEETFLLDYVLQSALPGTSFNRFTVHVYVPASPQYSTRLADLQVFAALNDGTRTANIYTWATFIERTTLNGQLYSEYEITASYNSGQPMNATNFTDIGFEMTVKHLDATDENDVVHERPLTVQIYKRPQ